MSNQPLAPGIGNLPESARTQSRMRILAVDDEPAILQLLEIALHASGNYTVAVAPSAQKAFHKIAEEAEPFDCLLLDIQMPAMTGIEVCAEVRKTPGYEYVPILMLTAMSDWHYLQKAFAAGATDYITKPFDLDDVRSKMGRARQRVQAYQIAISHVEDDRNQTAAVLEPRPDAPGYMFNSKGIDRCIQIDAFDKLVLKTTQAKKQASVYAIKVLTAMDDDLDKLRKIAADLSRHTASSQDLICYRGNGVFLMLRNGARRAPPRWFKTNMRAGGTTDPATRQAGMVVGDPIDLQTASVSNVLFEINSAVAQIEDLAFQSSDWRNYRQWRDASRSHGRAQRCIERKAYASMLEDFLGNGTG